MSQTTHHVRTIMTMEGNMKRELQTVDGQLHRVKETSAHTVKGIKNIARNTTIYGKKVNKLSKSLNGAAMRFVGITMAIGIAAMAFRKLNQWIDTSVENFRAFDNSMAEVSTILTGKAYQATETLTRGVRQLAVQYGQSAVDMSRGLYQILSAAVAVEESLNLLNVATKASIAGLTSVETSVDVLTSIINSYGKSVSQAAGVSDILFQTVVRGKLRFEDLASSLGYITPIAAAAGVAFEEIAAALATVTRMGLHVDMASRGLALTIQNIVSPTKQAKDAANEFGVDMSAVAIRVFGLKGFITDLSEAVKEFGLAVLPRMVRNMRSLRVVMALASEEGLKGFAEDLDLVYASTGRTDEALSKMIATQQREAAVVKQSMEVLERSIGEVWSPIKINIEATKLWFASFFTGGFNIFKANDAIKDLSETVRKNREQLYKTIDLMGSQGQKSIFNQLFDMEDYDPSKIATVVKSMTDMGDVADYLTAQQRALKGGRHGGNIFEDTIQDLEMLKNSLKYGSITSQSIIFEDITSEAAEEFDFSEYKKGTHVIGYLEDAIKDVNKAAEDNISTMTDNADAFNTFWSSIDTAREQVFNFKTNILELQNAIFGLSSEVKDIFTDLSGQEHEGTLGMEIDIKSFDTAMDRIGKFSTMIKNYGSEWEDMFYDIFEGKTYSMGDEEINYIEEYDSSIKDAVNTVYDFAAAQKEVKKVMNEVNKVIQANNLAIAELQLKGMIRRRGATRAEGRAIKKLTIENMKERLKEKRAQVEKMGALDKTAYEEAQNDIKEYFDSQKFYSFLMKDAREDELAHMVETFDKKKATLKHYEEALTTQEGHLLKAHQIEVDLLTWIQEEFPAIADMYKSVYEVSIYDSIQKAIGAMEEWNVLQGKDTTSDITSDTKEDKSTKSTSPKIVSPIHRVSTKLKEQFEKRGLPVPSTLERLVDMSKPKSYKVHMSVPKSNTKLKVYSTSFKSKTFTYRNMAELMNARRGQYSAGKPLNWKRGTYSVPKDMLAMVHQNETITPAGKDTGSGDTIIENVIIQVREIADIGSVEKVAAALGAVRQANTTSRQGISKYRLR